METDDSMTIFIDLEKSIPPDGYEFTGEYRAPKGNEYHACRVGDIELAVFCCGVDLISPKPILRKL